MSILANAPSDPLADSEALYHVDEVAWSVLTPTDEEPCEGCGEIHDDRLVGLTVTFPGGQKLALALDPYQALSVGLGLARWGHAILSGAPDDDE